MRILWLFGWLALMSACSSYGVRCNTRLRPINVPEPQAATAAPRSTGMSLTNSSTSTSGDGRSVQPSPPVQP
jgi:hypothetical protein